MRSPPRCTHRTPRGVRCCVHSRRSPAPNTRPWCLDECHTKVLRGFAPTLISFFPPRAASSSVSCEGRTSVCCGDRRRARFWEEVVVVREEPQVSMQGIPPPTPLARLPPRPHSGLIQPGLFLTRRSLAFLTRVRSEGRTTHPD